jgi:hypothetical protein
VSSGRGTAWLAKAGFHNRHCLPSSVHGAILVDGAISDKLREFEGVLAINMSFRSEGREVSPSSLGHCFQSEVRLAFVSKVKFAWPLFPK